MKKVLHKADTRGQADHGWLKSFHSFSFAEYHNPERMRFGMIRVLNDDTVAPGMGFGMHPHENMEIVSIPLEGDLRHSDSMGNETIIRQGDIQVMSAGTGIRHSEYNANSDRDVKFLQIWIFPDKKNVTPRYDQKSLSDLAVKNEFYQVLSPNPDSPGVWIHQQAWMFMANFDKGQYGTYKLHNTSNGLYVFVLNGSVSLCGEQLQKRDALGVWDVESVDVTADSDAELLVLEVPLSIG